MSSIRPTDQKTDISRILENILFDPLKLGEFSFQNWKKFVNISTRTKYVIQKELQSQNEPNID